MFFNSIRQDSFHKEKAARELYSLYMNNNPCGKNT